MAETEIPDVDDTGLTRAELEEAASEVGVEPDGLDDQELLEQLGVALGVVDETELRDDADSSDEEPGADEAEPAGAAATDAEAERREGRPGRAAGLRARVASGLEGVADKVRPDGAVGDDEAGEPQDTEGADEAATSAADPSGDEQPAVGEPIDGPTRDELRAELKELGLPVSGSKDELAQRLAEARQATEEQDGDDGSATGASGLRERVARALAQASRKVDTDASERPPGDGAASASAAEADGDADDGARGGIRGRLGRTLVAAGERLQGTSGEDAAEDADGDDDGRGIGDRVLGPPRRAAQTIRRTLSR